MPLAEIFLGQRRLPLLRFGETMCTEHSSSEITVCDVAIGDVKASLSALPSVEFIHKPYEGTLVRNADPSITDEFLHQARQAIALHSGGPA